MWTCLAGRANLTYYINNPAKCPIGIWLKSHKCSHLWLRRRVSPLHDNITSSPLGPKKGVWSPTFRRKSGFSFIIYWQRVRTSSSQPVRCGTRAFNGESQISEGSLGLLFVGRHSETGGPALPWGLVCELWRLAAWRDFFLPRPQEALILLELRSFIPSLLAILPRLHTHKVSRDLTPLLSQRPSLALPLTPLVYKDPCLLERGFPQGIPGPSQEGLPTSCWLSSH